MARELGLTANEQDLLAQGLDGVARNALRLKTGGGESSVRKHVATLLEKAHRAGYDGESFVRLVADVLRRHR